MGKLVIIQGVLDYLMWLGFLSVFLPCISLVGLTGIGKVADNELFSDFAKYYRTPTEALYD